MALQDGVALGRRLIEEMRISRDDESFEPWATDALRWGGEELDDDTVWAAAMSAAEWATEDGERWALGDGLIDESIATRPHLRKRWQALRNSNAAVGEVYRVMRDPRWNWGVDEESWWMRES